MSEEPKKTPDQAKGEPNPPSAEGNNQPRPPDGPPEGSDGRVQELSDLAADRAEKSVEAAKEEIAAVGNVHELTGELDNSTEAKIPDLKPSALETVIDKIVMLSHDEFLGRGNGRFIDEDLMSDGPSNEPRPTFDLIRERPGKGPIFVSLVEWRESRPKLFYGSSIEYQGRQRDVPTLLPALSESLLLPTELIDYGTTADLFKKISGHLERYLALFKNQSEILAYWCIASWFPDALDFIPRLTITGPRFAADVLFQVLRYVCRRPVLLAGMNSAVLKAIPFNELLPTLLIREPVLSKRCAELLDASDQKDYLFASGKDLQRFYSAKCIYLGEDYSRHMPAPNGVHVHVRNAISLGASPHWDVENQVFQNKLFYYRSLNYDRVKFSRFMPDGLLPELCAVAQQLGSAIVGDDNLQKRVIDLLAEQSEHGRIDRANGPKAMVLRAVLFHCHQSDQQQVFAREIAATVNRIYSEEEEPQKVSSETVGHLLKGLGLYTRRLGNGGRGLRLDKSTQFQAHELCHAYEVLPDVPVCGYCHQLQVPQSK